MSNKTNDVLKSAINISLQKIDIDTVRYNASRELKELVEEAREYERKARALRDEIRIVRLYAEATERVMAIGRAKDQLASQGMTEDEVIKYLENHAITWDVVNE